MDEKMILTPLQLVLRASWIVVTGTAALAFIVISFVSNTWESIPLQKQHFAFVVVNASGAHFIISFAFAWPCILIGRLLPYWSIATSVALGSTSYLYCALILQHRGLADSLLSETWVSIFPFGQAMIDLVRGPNLEMFFYLIPLAAAWTVAITFGLILGFIESKVKKVSILPRTARRQPSQPRQRRRAGGRAKG